MRQQFFRRALALSASAAVLAVAAPALAQDQESEEDELELEEIVVTADREDSFGADFVQAGSFRGARVIDTPLTVSVIPKELLDAQQAVQLIDALRNTPGVTSSQTSPTVYNNLSIRGIPVENRSNYRLNGSLPINNLIDLPLENKARVEALKGASALYYGFSTPSGIINLTTKRPPKEPLFFANMFGNLHGQIQGHFDAGGTWGILGARVNVAGGSVDNGIDRTNGHRSFESLALQLDPTDDIQLNLDVEHIYKKVTEPTVLRGPTTRAALLRVLPALPRPETNPGSEGFLNRAEGTNVLGRASWDISRTWSFLVEGGISYVERDRRFSSLNNLDPVTGNGTLNATAADGQLYRNRNGRVELAGTFATGPVIHELLLGASKNIRRQYSAPAVAITNATNCIALGLPANCRQNGYNPTPLNFLTFSGTAPYNPSRDTKIHDTGFYAFDRAHFGGPNDDLISILVGVRKSIYKETQQGPNATTEAPFTTFEDKPLSISGGLVVKPVRWASAYVTYIEGLESTRAAPTGTANEGQALPASETVQYEGGFKIEPKDNLLFTAAYFDIKRENTYTNPQNVFVKDGQASFRGFEFSLTGEVTPEISLYASALFLKTRQGNTDDLTLVGNRIENVPKTQWSLFSEYRPGFLPGFAINGGAYHTGARAINPENTLFVPGYTLFDLGGSYTFELGGYEMVARVNAENITGKRYFASTSSNFFAFGPPPSVKLSLSAKIF